jgi:DmsE family decaheme c-type cytochrome
VKTHRTKTHHVLFLSVLAACLTLGIGLTRTATGDAGFVGSEKCKDCHATVAESHGKSLHARAWATKGGNNGCESCHGPAGDHIAKPAIGNIISFSKKSKQTADEQSKQCLECHSASTALMNWDMGFHKKEDVSCAACHDIHSGKPAKEADTCFGCHKDTRRDANKQSHHPIIEGKIKCSDCHNPHGTLAHGMIKDENINQLCYQCHADKRGPYIWEHPPVEENCLTCHNPHGSKTSKMLTERVPTLCQNCHDGSGGHNATPWDATAGFTGSQSLGNKEKVIARSCVNCHTNIHGSMAPTGGSGANAGKAFLR